MPSLEDAPTLAPGLCRAPDPAAATAAQAAGKKPPWVVSTAAAARWPPGSNSTSATACISAQLGEHQ